ncbi:MAG: D-alanyl-D-alanine carboxypeptidase family protein [Tissierellia bacterium]|nr:D-alanyl-D-alanine carboxypeptidase family protein [Tissierellia bacterium]
MDKVKKLLPLLLALLFLLPGEIHGVGEAAEGELPPNEGAAPLLLDEKGEPIPPDEIRNQDLLIHTREGIQQANLKEYNAYQEALAKPNEALLDAYFIGDFASGKELQAHNADAPHGIASVTKVMTIYVALDAIAQGKIDWKDPVTVSHKAAVITGSGYKSKEGDVFTVEELIHAGLIVSGNDAMIALAEHIAGSEEAYVLLMRKKAQELGLTSAHFINVHGLTDYTVDDYNRMSPRDIFHMTSSLLREHPVVLEISSRMTIQEPQRNFLGYNTNPLMGIVPEVDGFKTGYTNAAGRCLVATTQRGATRLIFVFLGAQNDMDRYAATRRMVEGALDRYQYQNLGNPEEPVKTLHLENASPRELEIYPAGMGQVLLDGEKELDYKLELSPIAPPLKEGAKVGTITYTQDGEAVYTTDLITHKSLRHPNPILRLQEYLARVFRDMEGAMG